MKKYCKVIRVIMHTQVRASPWHGQGGSGVSSALKALEMGSGGVLVRSQRLKEQKL